MEKKVNIASLLLIIALIASYFFFLDKIETLESQLTVTDTVESERAVITDPPILASQLDDINNQLIDVRSELRTTQQKLIVSASKSAVLEDELAQTKEKIKAFQPIKQELEEAKKALKLSELKLQTSVEDHNQLQADFAKQNKAFINRSLDRIKLLNQTSSGVSMTASAVPFVGVAALIVYTQDQTKKSCEDIKDIIDNENKVFGETLSLEPAMLAEYQEKCD